MRQAFAILPSAGQSVTHRLKGLRKGLEYGVKGQEGFFILWNMGRRDRRVFPILYPRKDKMMWKSQPG